MMEDLLQGKKRLHFFLNEKVVNDAISAFEMVFPGEDLYVILSKDGSAPLVKRHPNTLFLSYRSRELRWILKNSRRFQEIICHSLWTELDRIVAKLDHPNITWVIWGADLFEELLYRNGYKLYFDEPQLYRVRAQHMPVPIYKMLTGFRDAIHYRCRINALKHINNVCATAPKDIELLTRYVKLNKAFNAKRLFYYSIDQILDPGTLNSYVSGSDIWVNNSAAYNGNHLAVFKRIQGFKRKETVHVPLSYGMKKYASFVEREGREMLGACLDPIMTFIPRDEYYKRFLCSNAFIFGHLRGCATGNVVVALYLGAKVFLFKDNVLYDFFKEMEVTLYSIEDELNEDSAYTPLPPAVRQKNRAIIQDRFSQQQVLHLIKDNFS